MVFPEAVPRHRSSVLARQPDVPLHDWIKNELLSTLSPFRRDFQADGATPDTLRSIVNCEAFEGEDCHNAINVAGTCFYLLDLAWVCFLLAPTEAAFEIVLKIVSKVGVAEQIEAYRTFASHACVTPVRLRSLTKRIVLSARAPIAMALLLGSRCCTMAKKHVGRHGPLMSEADFCTKLSIELLKNLGNEHLGALALLTRDPALKHRNALEFASAKKNKEFIADPIVSRILFNIWAIPRYLQQQTFSAPGYVPVNFRLNVLFQQNPKQFLETNQVKFQLQIVFLFLYVVLMSYSALDRVSVRSLIAQHELAVWILGIGFVLGEASSVRSKTFRRYCRSGWNCVAMVIWTAMLLEACIRLFGSQGFVKESTIGGAQIALWSSKSLFIILLWLKLMRQFTVLPAVGALHKTLFLIAGYLAHFSLFLAVFCMGFGIALTYAVGDSVESYRTVFGAWFTLYQGALSQFSFSDFEALTVGKRIVASTLVGVFLLIATLILLKTMIVAILNNTYGRVRDQSELEYAFGFAQLVLETHSESSVLPAPANLLIYVLALPIRIWNAIERRVFPPADGWTCAYCYLRNPLRDRHQILALFKSWISNLEDCSEILLDSLPIEEIELCSGCSSFKKLISDSERIHEKISFVFFVFVLWAPISFVFWTQRTVLAISWQLARFFLQMNSSEERARLRRHRSTFYKSKTKSVAEGPAVQVFLNPCEKFIRAWVQEHLEKA